MSSFIFSGGVEVLGFISPTDTSDEYAVIDPLYGIDGLRNVSSISELNAITTLRRRPGMVVGVNNGSEYYKLNPAPWNGTLTDWSLFTPGIFTGGTVTGETNFTSGVTATVFSAGTYLNLPIDSTVTGGTYNPSTGSITFTNNTGGTFTITGFITGFTDIQVTGYTYSDNTFTIYDSSGNTFSATINQMTGLTVNGAISATTISGGTFYGDGSNITGVSLNVGVTNIVSGSSGGVLFQNTSNKLQQSPNLYWDNVNNRLGIGTSTPSGKLHIRQSADASTDGLFMTGFLNASSARMYVNALGNLTFNRGGTDVMGLTTNGSLLINNSIDTGFKLDVNGTARVQGVLSVTASGDAITVNSGQFALQQVSGVVSYRGALPFTSGYAHLFNTISSAQMTSGEYGLIRLNQTFNPLSGTSVYNLLGLTPTINQTGGASGITRGIYINPTLTSAADFRSIETSAGNVLFNNNFSSSTLNENGLLLLNTTEPQVFGSNTSPSIVFEGRQRGNGSTLISKARIGFQPPTSAVVGGDFRIDVWNGTSYVQTFSVNPNGTINLPISSEGQISYIGSATSSIVGPARHRFTTGGPLGGSANAGICLVGIVNTYNPSTGSGSESMLRVFPTINQTGTASGIFRGVYVDPIMSAITSTGNWRSIEWSNNIGWGLYGTGTANNYLGGKLLLNTTTDAGFQLDVNGTARVQGTINIGTNSNVGIGSTLNGSTFVNNGSAILYASANINATQVYAHNLFTGSFSSSSGTQGIVNLTGAIFAPTNGTAIFNTINATPTINQTGGASGTTRGLYINPTLTSSFDWRSIEWSNNTGWGLYGTGIANNYLGGRLGIGTTSLTNTNLNIGGNISGSISSASIRLIGTVQSDVVQAEGVLSTISIANNFTLNTLNHFYILQGVIGTGSILNSQNGFFVGFNFTGATNNFGFRGQVPSGANRWNLYMDGTALNYLSGGLLLNTTTNAGYQLDVNGTTRIQNKLSVGTPTQSSAVMEITSTSQGLLIPRMTSAQKNAISSPAVGLMVFDTDNGLTEIYDSFWGWMPIANQNDWMRKWGMSYWNDFGANNAFNDGVYTTFATNGGGQGITTTPFPLPSNPYIGFQGLRTGVNSNGTAQLRTDVNVGRYIYFGNGKFQFESRVFIRTLSTGTDRYNLIVGFSNSTSSTMTAGCTFIYDEGGVGTGTLASPNWQIMTSYLSVRTVVDTGVVVSASTFYNFRVDINDNSTVVNYYLNDILVRTETTNIPVDGSIGPQPIIGITKTVGTTDIGILVDYIGLKKKFTTPR